MIIGSVVIIISSKPAIARVDDIDREYKQRLLLQNETVESSINFLVEYSIAGLVKFLCHI